MAETDFEDEEPEEGEEDLTSGLERKRFSGKKISMFAGAGLVIVGGAYGAYSFFFAPDPAELAEAEAAAAAVVPAAIYFDLDEILVNLNTGGRGTTYLKVKIALEIADQKSADAVEQNLPRIIDQFQVYLRELRLEDLDGSAGMFRLKEELLRRVNASIAPARVEDILFKELLVQ